MNQGRDIKVYAQYMRDQVRELLTEFGPVDILWFDFSYPMSEHNGLKGKGRADWESEELLKLIRDLAPEIILDDRLDVPGSGDIYTPEQFQPTSWPQPEGRPVVWEACQTLSGSWGYHRDETTWKSPQQLIQMLINTVAKGGNLLMNVGPTARGTLDSRALNALQVYAAWMHLHERSIYGCTQSDFTAPGDCRYTQSEDGKRLYVHVFAWPYLHLHLPELAGKIEYAQLLHDASELPLKLRDWSSDQVKKQIGDGTLTLELPIIKPDVVVPVIELFLKSAM